MTPVRTPVGRPGAPSGRPLEHSQPAVDGAGPETEALFREAKRRERQRRLVLMAAAVVVVGSLAVVVVQSRRSPTSPPRASSPPAAPQPGAIRTGPVAPLEVAGPLAVSSGGVLYVADERRDQILERLPDGGFRVVAGDGTHGFAGDGGSATKAQLSNVSDLAVGAMGALYIADGGRVRVVTTAGVIRTIAGDGGPGVGVVSGMPALSASLGAPVSLAFSPTGELYLGTSTQLLRLTTEGTLATVRAVVPSGVLKGNLVGFDHIAVDALGNIDVGTGYAGWSIFQVAPDGVATQIGYARRNGGNTSVVEREPNGSVIGENGDSLVMIEGDRLGAGYTFTKVPGTKWFSLSYFALEPNGRVFADDIGTGGFQPLQQLVAVDHGHVAVLWHHRIADEG